MSLERAQAIAAEMATLQTEHDSKMDKLQEELDAILYPKAPDGEGADKPAEGA